RWHWPAGDVFKKEGGDDLPHRLVSAPVILRGQKSEVKDRKEEGGDQRSEVRDQKSEVGGQKTEGAVQLCIADAAGIVRLLGGSDLQEIRHWDLAAKELGVLAAGAVARVTTGPFVRGSHVGCVRSEEHTSELQSRVDLVCRLLLEKKK